MDSIDKNQVWSTETLNLYLSKIMDERDRAYQQRWEAQEKAVSAALSAAEKAVAAAPIVAGIKASIIFEKKKSEVILKDKETILEAAIRIGLDPPYACQGGSCCTCRALLEEGNVQMAVNYGLSSSEVKKGYILTCQSRPTTPTVLVNYDKG